MVTEIEKASKEKGIAISGQQALGFPNARWNELINAVCEKCGDSFVVLMDWPYHDRPRHFYCSEGCYFTMLSERKESSGERTTHQRFRGGCNEERNDRASR